MSNAAELSSTALYENKYKIWNTDFEGILLHSTIELTFVGYAFKIQCPLKTTSCYLVTLASSHICYAGVATPHCVGLV